MIRMMTAIVLVLGLVAATGASAQEAPRPPRRARLRPAGTDQPEYRDRGAARDAARHRQVHRRADSRVPAEERRVQEGRGPDERARHRREELSEDEAADHRDRAEVRVAVAERETAGTAMPAVVSCAGYTLIELMAVVCVVAILGGIAGRTRLSAVDHSRGHAAARYLAGRLGLARSQAWRAAPRSALRFDQDPRGFSFSVFQDGNGNGIRTADIEAGIDRPLEPAIESVRTVSRRRHRADAELAGARTRCNSGEPTS